MTNGVCYHLCLLVFNLIHGNYFTEIYGDPHFSVPLLHGGKLCYSIQGVPGLAFNLLSSRHLIINALFIDSVNDPTQATWIGKLAVVPHHVRDHHVIQMVI